MKIILIQKKLGLFIALILYAFVAFGQIQIADRAGLEAISNDLSASYMLIDDVDLSGEAWLPLGEFRGTLNGNGKIIRGLRFNNSSTNSVGLFKTSKNATIKRLGFEAVEIIGRNQVGIIVGNAVSSTFEQCYVSNSYVKGNDHVGSICGRIQEATIIRNCYATSRVETNTQSGGLVGVAECSAVSKSYFSGTVNATKRANGIVGLVDKTDDFMKVEYCVNLAPSLTATNVTDLYRIIHDGGKTVMLTQNYSLSTTLIGAPGFQLTRTSNNPSSKDGKDISPADASTQEFYESTLGWDFSTIWDMPAFGYPRLQWQSATREITVFAPSSIKVLTSGSTINLNEYLPTSHGYKLLEFATTNPNVEISEEGVLSVKEGLGDILENITITFTAKSGYVIAASLTTNPYAFQLLLKNNAVSLTSNRKIKVSSFNIRNDNSGDATDGNGWVNRLPVIKDMILFHDLDIVGTQECKSNQVSDLRNSLLNFGYDYIGRGRGTNPTDDEFSAIFYKADRYKLLDSGDFWLSETPDVPSKGWDAALNRICTWGYFEEKSNGFKFFAFNLHLDHVGVKARKYGSEVVVERIKIIANGQPAFLTGDFNVDQHSQGYEIITAPCLMSDSFLAARIVYNPTGTFNSFSNTTVTTQRIDHVFITDHFVAERYGVLTDKYWTDITGNPSHPENFPPEASVQQATPRLPSDHYPVVVELIY